MWFTTLGCAHQRRHIPWYGGRCAGKYGRLVFFEIQKQKVKCIFCKSFLNSRKHPLTLTHCRTYELKIEYYAKYRSIEILQNKIEYLLVCAHQGMN